MEEEKTYIPQTEDEPELSAIADGLETADEFEAAETEDEVLSSREMERQSKKSKIKRAEKYFIAGNGPYYRKMGREILPYLLAVLILLAVTQTAAGILWSCQEKRLEDLYQIYGAEYGQK